MISKSQRAIPSPDKAPSEITGFDEVTRGGLPSGRTTLSVPQEAAPADLGVLAALVGDDESMIEEIVRAFLASSAATRAEIAQAVVDNRMDAVANAGHRLKSGARAVGAWSLGLICEQIEDGALTGHLDDVRDLQSRFENELDRVDCFLRAG